MRSRIPAIAAVCLITGVVIHAQGQPAPQNPPQNPGQPAPQNPAPAPVSGAAQEKQAAPRVTITAVMVEVTISRYQGDKRISSVPYTLAMRPDDTRVNLRIGGEVAIPSISGPAPAGSSDEKALQAQARTSYTYRSIGTNIDVTARSAEEGRFNVALTVEDSSIYPPGEAGKNMTVVTGAPAFRSFRSYNTLTLRDGQSIDYTAATDRISGETARISVKLTVVK